MLTHPPYNGEEITVSPCSPFPSNSRPAFPFPGFRIERSGLPAGKPEVVCAALHFSGPRPRDEVYQTPLCLGKNLRCFPEQAPHSAHGPLNFVLLQGLAVQRGGPGPSDIPEPGRSPAMQPVEIFGRCRLYGYAFMPQQPGLALLPPGIPPDCSILPDNAMTGHHNRNRVVCIGTGCCPYGSRVPAFHCKTMI